MNPPDPTALFTRADLGDVAGLQELLAQGVDPNASDSQGFTALEYALNWYPHIPDKDHLAIVKALVEAGADVNAHAVNGQTPLFTAAATGLYDVVVYLHRHGADLNTRLDTGANALHDVAQGLLGRPENYTVTMEIDGERRTLTDPDEIRAHLGQHPDDEYAQRLATAQYLVENGLDVNAETHERHQTALHRAADLGVPEVVALILGTGQADVDHQDGWGTTALHYACRGGHLPVVRLLVEAGADVNVQENYGYAPLHEAAENGHLEVVELLLAHGSDPRLGLRQSFQDYPAGATALDMARAKRHGKVVECLEAHAE